MHPQITVLENQDTHQDQTRSAQKHLVNTETASLLAETFQALADPSRVRLISALTRTELCVYDLAAVLGMSQSAVSHQLQSLRNLRIVKGRRAGREIFYTLDDDHIRDLFEFGLKHVQHG
ncbi:MAG: ArsR/SmtB family transcription factor [Anaerolineaceae bacterium]